MIPRCLGSIDENQIRAMSVSVRGDGGCRSYLQGGTDHQHQIGCLGAFEGSTHFFFRHGLAERDGGGFDQSLTLLAARVQIAGFQARLNFANGPSSSATETHRFSICSVEFNDPVGRIPRFLMQAIYILRDDTFQPPSPFQFGQGLMSLIGPGSFQLVVEIAFHGPELHPCLVASYKLLKGDHAVSIPHAAGTAKIRQSALRRNSGPGKRSYPAGIPDQGDTFLNACVE